MNGIEYMLDDHLAGRTPGIRGHLGKLSLGVSKLSTGELLNGIGTMPLTEAARGTTSAPVTTSTKTTVSPPAVVVAPPPPTTSKPLPGSGSGYQSGGGGSGVLPPLNVSPPDAQVSDPSTPAPTTATSGWNPWLVALVAGGGILAVLALAGRRKG